METEKQTFGKQMFAGRSLTKGRRADANQTGLASSSLTISLVHVHLWSPTMTAPFLEQVSDPDFLRQLRGRSKALSESFIS